MILSAKDFILTTKGYMRLSNLVGSEVDILSREDTKTIHVSESGKYDLYRLNLKYGINTIIPAEAGALVYSSKGTSFVRVNEILEGTYIPCVVEGIETIDSEVPAFLLGAAFSCGEIKENSVVFSNFSSIQMKEAFISNLSELTHDIEIGDSVELTDNHLRKSIVSFTLESKEQFVFDIREEALLFSKNWKKEFLSYLLTASSDIFNEESVLKESAFNVSKFSKECVRSLRFLFLQEGVRTDLIVSEESTYLVVVDKRNFLTFPFTESVFDVVNDMSSTDYYKDSINSELISLLASKCAFNRESKDDFTTFTLGLVEDRTSRYSETFLSSLISQDFKYTEDLQYSFAKIKSVENVDYSDTVNITFEKGDEFILNGLILRHI